MPASSGVFVVIVIVLGLVLCVCFGISGSAFIDFYSRRVCQH